ncbi:helix-turn-helix transcriptional regulator [Mycobacterium sp. MMS18-G62]
MSSNHPAQRLRGRSNECEVLERLISGARSGQSQVLVLRGEAGIGKTALLEYVSERASGFCVVRAAGVQSDMELAFAGLQQLCAPLLDRCDRLPEPQRDALTTAFGLSAGTTPDRFLVGLAVLSLLAAAAEDGPVVCLVDDAQWLDRVSAQTLAFVARRLMAEPVALVFASREPGEELTGLPELTIRGLRNGDARALLESAILGRLDERVRDRIVAETRGNPLALLELPRDITAAELAGGFGLPDAGPLAGQIEQSFIRRIHSLPMQTQRLLLTAAAEPVGDAPLLTRAVQQLGIGADAAAPAKAAGLVEIGTRVRFRHPLVRSAVYRAADLADRQEIHRALAEATDPQSDADRRAWHRAHAAVGPDEDVAAELERSADRAQVRGGVAAAAAFLQRATELTPDPARRAARGLAAAQAEFEAGALDAAYELLAMVDLGPLDELQRALVVRLGARIVFARSRGSGATPMLLDAAKQLLDAAKRLEPLDRGLGRETYIEAIGAAMFAGRLGGPHGAKDAAEAAAATPPGAQPVRPVDLLLDGMATLITRGPVVGLPKLRAALGSIQSEVQRRSGGDVLRWLWLAFPIAQETAAHELWDDEAWHQLATHAVRLARDAGALAVLPAALVYRAGVHVHAGEFAAASALIEEADAITAATGHSPLKYHSVVLAAWRGDETAAVRLIEAGVQDATARGEGRVVALAGYATALLYNGLGRYQDALAAAQRACEHEDVGFFGWTLVELIEADARSGEHEVAVEALQRLEERTLVSGTDWALGILARSRALLSGGSEAGELYREAIERLARTRVVVHLARAHLLYGEWLRRENRRVDAREQLHIAHEMLSRIGAEAFADRCRRELLATGETVRKRTTGSGGGLTAQEAQIARLAGEGLTNQEIGAQLFISSHTVEWHLRKVFAKLGIKSRRQLRGASSPR